MNARFSEKLEEPLYIQVMDWMGRRIESGELAPGTRLPSTDGLAAELGVGRKVIQQALAGLSKRGLLERAPGRGTFISRSLHSDQIAVILETNLLVGGVYSFNRLFCNEVLKGARKRGFSPVLFFPTDKNDLSRCVAEIRQQERAGRIRAVISFGDVKPASGHIPWIAGGMVGLPTIPRESLAFRGLTYLISRGYQRIAVLEHNPANRPSPLTEQAVAQVLADHQARIEIRLYQGNNSSPNRDGRTVMKEILAEPGSGPDALLSLDDNLSRGAIFAILEQGLRIPQDIAVLSHANKGSAILSPVPLTMLENDPSFFAANLLDALEARLAGRQPVPLVNHARLLVGQSCGE